MRLSLKCEDAVKKLLGIKKKSGFTDYRGIRGLSIGWAFVHPHRFGNIRSDLVVVGSKNVKLDTVGNRLVDRRAVLTTIRDKTWICYLSFWPIGRIYYESGSRCRFNQKLTPSGSRVTSWWADRLRLTYIAELGFVENS